MSNLETLKEIVDWPHKEDCGFPSRKCACVARFGPLLVAELLAWRNWNDNIMACAGKRPTQDETNLAGRMVLDARKALDEA